MGRTHRQLFAEVCPGLIDRLDQLPGQYMDPDRNVMPTFGYDTNEILQRASMGVRKLLNAGPVLQILMSVRRRSPLHWNPSYVSFHLGPDVNDMTEVYFRIDLDPSGFHCHIRGEGLKPNKGGHINCLSVEPRPTLCPFDFLDLVDSFLSSGTLPLKRVRP